MTERSLQVTRRARKSAKTVPSADGLLVVDYAQDGRPIGVEITAPQPCLWTA